MDTKKSLLKHFSLVLKKRVSAEKNFKHEINQGILRYLNRKDLIEVIADKYSESDYASLKLAELENEELLTLIGDDLFIVGYVVKKWCKELSEKEQLVDIKPISNDEKKNTSEKSKKK